MLRINAVKKAPNFSTKKLPVSLIQKFTNHKRKYQLIKSPHAGFLFSNVSED